MLLIDCVQELEGLMSGGGAGVKEDSPEPEEISKLKAENIRCSV